MSSRPTSVEAITGTWLSDELHRSGVLPEGTTATISAVEPVGEITGFVCEIARLRLAFDGDGAFLSSLAGVAKVSDFGQYVEIRMSDGADPQALLKQAAERLTVRRFEIVVPSLHDIFVETVTDTGEEAA